MTSLWEKERKIEKRHKACGKPAKVEQCGRCKKAATTAFMCALFFLCSLCAKTLFARRWRRIFGSVLRYADSHSMNCVFFTLSQRPFASAKEGVDTTAKRWRKFLRKRLVSVSQHDFDRYLLDFEKNLRATGASEDEIIKALSRQRWAWRWWYFRVIFFDKGKDAAFAWFEKQTKADFQKDGRPEKDARALFAKEKESAKYRMEQWAEKKEAFEEESGESLEDSGKIEEEIEEIVRKKVRDRFCRVSGWIEAGAKRIEVKRSRCPEDGEFYFHIHVLAAVDVPLPNVVLSLLWSQVATGCSVTDVRKVDLKRRGDVSYYTAKVVEYSSKQGDEEFTPQQKMELQLAFYRRDMVSRIGWNQDELKKYEEEKQKPQKTCRCCGAVGNMAYMGQCAPLDYKIGNVIHSTKYFAGGREEHEWRIIAQDDQGWILEKLDPNWWLPKPEDLPFNLLDLYPPEMWKGG